MLLLALLRYLADQKRLEESVLQQSVAAILPVHVLFIQVLGELKPSFEDVPD